MGWRVVVLAVVLSSSVARAGSWTFSWHCESGNDSGCAAHSLGASGTEGPYSSESDCESARTQMAYRINSPGQAGSTDSCVDGASGGTTGGSSGPVRAAHVSRVFLGVTAGSGFGAGHADGRYETGSYQAGGQLDVTFGRDVIGLAIFADVAKDSGTPDPMWLFDFGVGLASSPFAFARRPNLEVRPEIGIYGIEMHRLSCGERCNTDGGLGTLKPAEPDMGFLWRLRIGLDVYTGARRAHGFSLDAFLQFGHLGDSSDANTLVVLTPPHILLRLAWIPVHDVL